jgi:glycosyltransferase involved in cell wall biosynthesis
MAIEEPRPGERPSRRPGGSIAVLAPRRERLAIVSTRNKLCGIASYTAALERQLADVFELTVFDLDQYLLRSRHPRVRALGDRHIKEICQEIACFDAVNLQLEFGTLGQATKDIYRRFSWLVEAAPRLSVTFHSLKRPPAFPLADFATALVGRKWHAALGIKAAFSRETKLSSGIASRLRRAQRQKPVSVIVHNRRDLSDVRHLSGLDRVFDHPLAFLSATDADAIHRRAARRRFPVLDRLSEDSALVGVFGFLNDYKGFGSVIRALHHLPPNHHLLIFGGTHPNEILRNQPVHPYVASLLRDGNVDLTLYDQIQASPRRDISLAVDIEHQITDLVGVHPRDLSNRLHFMGALDDTDFLTGMAVCDAVVFPYLEVGQSSSGPISQALELGCRIIASRTHTFLQFAQYHPNRIEFFDIGNHLELAERIAARPQYAQRREAPRYNVETNKAIYLAANSAPAPANRFRPGRLAAAERVERTVASAD